MKLDLNQTLNQLIRNYKQQNARLDVLEAVSDYKDGRYIDANVELRCLNQVFKELIDRVKEEYGDEVQSLLLYAAEQIFILEENNDV